MSSITRDTNRESGQKETFYASDNIADVPVKRTANGKLTGDLYEEEPLPTSTVTINDIIVDDVEEYDELGYGDCGDEEPNTPVDEIIQNSVSKNIRDLKTFFENGRFTTEKNDQHTNIINVAERRTYCIPETHIEDFFASLELCRRERRLLHFSERQETCDQAKSGIMLDFDCYQRDKTRHIGPHQFESLARRIGGILGEMLDIHKYIESQTVHGKSSYDDFKFRVFFIQKPEVVLAPTKEMPIRYKDGFHMLIPEIMVTRGLKKHLIKEIIDKNVLKSIFRAVPLCGDPNDALDTMSASVPVQFVGNTRPGKPAYTLSYACEVKMLADEDYTGINASPIDVELLNQGKVLVKGSNVNINLSYELSLYYNLKAINNTATWLDKRELDYVVTLESKIQNMLEKTSRGILDESILAENENSVDLLALNNAEAAYLKKLLGILDVSYATDYKKWFAVIMAIAHTGIQYKPIAQWFSYRRPESYSSGEFERVWGEATSSKYTGKPVTKRSIRQWARDSSPAAFEAIDKENYTNIIAREAYSNEGCIEHAGAAKLTYSMTSHKFVCDSDNATGKPIYQWFEFVTPGQAMRPGEVFKWRPEHDPDNIHLFIGEHVPKVYKELLTQIKDRKEQATDENLTKYWASVLKNFKMSQRRLGNDGYQKGVINQCKYRFRQRGFIAELDSYKDIIGVGNGVLKIGPQPELIRGWHEYKISKYTETNYVPYDENNPRIKTLLQAFRDVWVEPDVFEFMMMHAATGLDCNEAANLLLMCVGGGRNGKSFTARMIHETLGDMYCASGKSTLLVGGFEKGNEANSAQMQQKGKRYFYIDEFEQNSVLNTTRMKSCVSPNKQSGRDVYEKQGNFKNTCNTACFSNFDFIVDTNDHGTWRRIYYYKNKVKFCEFPNPNNPYEKKVDRRFMDVYPHDPLYREAMLSIMVHYYAKLCTEYGGDLNNIPVPTINYETELFRNRQDSVNRFITSMMVKSPGQTEPLKMSVVSAKYSDWYNVHIKKYTGKNAPADATPLFDNSYLSDFLKTIDGNHKFLEGYRILGSENEELQSGESRIGSAVKPKEIIPLTKETLAAETQAVLSQRDVGESPWNIDELTNNVKPCIQSVDAIKPNELEAIDSFLDEIGCSADTKLDLDGTVIIDI